jgi:cyclophilin family peptidyl-prolyl cis-trans isomerase
VLAQLQKKYPQDVRIAYRYYPLKIHDKAALAAQAAEAAGMQGRFWEMHDLLFEQQDEWKNFSFEQFKGWLVRKAGELELDTEKFKSDLNSDRLVKMARDAYEQNAAIGMPGTPFLVINGSPYSGPLNSANLEAVVALTVLEKRQFSECPVMTIDPGKQYFAVLKTEKGDITIELFADRAPLAVNSFIFLAKQDWFDNVTFHRVIPDFVAQAGDPTGTGFGGPGYAFDNEIDPHLKFDRAGVVAMANAGAGSNGSQFFITYTAIPRLDGEYTIFGQVIQGMEVALKLAPRNPAENMDLPPGDRILDVEIIEK